MGNGSDRGQLQALHPHFGGTQYEHAADGETASWTQIGACRPNRYTAADALQADD